MVSSRSSTCSVLQCSCLSQAFLRRLVILGALLRIRELKCSLKALSCGWGLLTERHSSDLEALYFRKPLIPFFVCIFFFLIFFLGWSQCLEGNFLSPHVVVNWGNRARERGLGTECPHLWCPFPNQHLGRSGKGPFGEQAWSRQGVGWGGAGGAAR